MAATVAQTKTKKSRSTSKPAAQTGAGPVGADELAQRVNLLRRLRELLIQQRERFQGYLSALEKQQVIIESGSADDLLAYVELEEKMVADIFSIQKVISPLEKMYQATIPFSPSDDVPSLKSTLENLKNQAVIRSAHNRKLLSTRMAEIRAEITGLRNNPFANMSRSMYQNSVTASLVDIRG
jgi:hypothetical protein